jgi:hypothetical protein
MSERRQYHGRSGRAAHRFQPEGWESRLEARLLLSTGPRLGVLHTPLNVAYSTVQAVRQPSHQPRGRVVNDPPHAPRVTPAAEINAQYDAFLADFLNVEQAYITAITEQSTGTVTVSATLTAPYPAGSNLIQVDNASVFGPNGTFSAPVSASATLNNVPLGVTYILTGRSGNNMLIVNPNPTPQNAGVVLIATVPTTAQTSAAAIFPSFIVNRTNQMGINLVQYFNSLPLKLPKLNAPPHTPINRGAIQNYVYNSVAGSAPTSLQQSLLAIPLPTTAGSDLQIYEAAVNSAVEQSRIRTLDGVSQVYAGRLLISAPAPANRLGVNLNTSSGTSSTTG